VISHAGDEEIVAFDQHIFYDESADRLWMAWGGNVIFISELDPKTGKLLKPQPNPEVVTHPRGLHQRVADRDEDGDRWTSDNGWIEGPTIYKHDGYWYLFASYGSLANNYTIRMGRSKQPTGPYLDKDKVPLTQYDPGKDRFGSSFFLGDDGEQVVSGHAHFWEEEGQFYVGYDYRTHKARNEQEDREARDILGIRKMYWVRGWPTIWTPITISFDADDDPDAVGKKIGIALKNNGDRGSVAAFDWVNLEVADEVTDSPTPQ
jgi:arabinan endo-1,5-alpha-L-arabinosidase